MNWRPRCKRRPKKLSICRKKPKRRKKLYGLNNQQTRNFGEPLPDRPPAGRARRPLRAIVPPLSTPGTITTNIRGRLPPVCQRADQPSAALVKDLESPRAAGHHRGPLGWRDRPAAGDGGSKAIRKTAGRDHNGQGFSMWLAGGGFRGGMTFGATDEVGHRAVENIVTPNDFQATLLQSVRPGSPEARSSITTAATKRLTDGRPGPRRQRDHQIGLDVPRSRQ